MMKSLLNSFNFLQAIKSLNIRKRRKTWSSWKSWKFGFLAFSLLFFNMQFGTAQTPIPNLNAGVMDSAGILSSNESEIINQKIMQLEAEFGSQVAVLIIPELQDDEDILDYSVRVMEEWKLGRLGIDDGLLLVVALNDRKMRIEVGYDLEGTIPDITAYQIIEQHLQPAFRSNQYALGINNALDVLIPLIQAEQASKTAPSTTATTSKGFGILDLLFIYLIAGSLLLWGWLIYRGTQRHPFITVPLLLLIIGLMYYFEGFQISSPNMIFLSASLLKEHLPLWMQQLLTLYLPSLWAVILLFSMVAVSILTVIKVFSWLISLFSPPKPSNNDIFIDTSPLEPQIFNKKPSKYSSWEAHKANRRLQMRSHQERTEQLTKNSSENTVLIDHLDNAVHHSDELQKNSEHYETQYDESNANAGVITKKPTPQTASHKEAPTIIDTGISHSYETFKGYAEALNSPEASPKKLRAGFFLALGLGTLIALFSYAYFENLLVSVLFGISVLIYQVLYRGTNLTKNRGFKALFQAIPSSASYGIAAFFIADLTIAILVTIGFILLQTLLLVSGAIKQPFRVIIISRGSSSGSSSDSSRGSSSSSSSSSRSSSGRTGGGGRSGGGGASGSW